MLLEKHNMLCYQRTIMFIYPIAIEYYLKIYCWQMITHSIFTLKKKGSAGGKATSVHHFEGQKDSHRHFSFS